jgi:hypothetical protein
MKGRNMNLTTIDTLEAAVAKGVAYLDSRYPGWRWRVQEDMVEANCPIHSIAGQLFGDALVDQLRGVGIEPDNERPWESIAEFTAMGFGVMTSTPVEVPEGIRETMASLGVAVDPVIGVPRDFDQCVMEGATLEKLWIDEIRKR